MSKLSAYAARSRSGPALWLVLALLASYPLAGLMPLSWAVENGVVENLQVAALAAGAVCAVRYARRSSMRADALLAAVLVPVWVTLAGRELSWGAAFLPPSGVVDGVALYSSRYLVYKPLVAPLIMLAALAILVIAWRHALFGHAWRLLARRPQIAPPLAIIVLAGLVSSCAEGHLGHLTIGKVHAMALEETLELVAYLALVAAQALALRAPATPPAGSRTSAFSPPSR